MTDQTRLDALLVRYEELRAQGTPVAAAELCRDCPDLEPALRQQIQVLESMNALLGDAAELSASTVPPGTGPAPAPADLAVGAHYRVLRLHAQGGLGEVHVARDEALQRDVALKRLQALHARNPHSRRRFLREAEITSRLEHPNIVPVHTVGQDADGRPFYAMRFVQGETLHDAIQRFHAAEQAGRDPGERRLALRQLVSRFVAVCNTVAYAHSRGIVHRDLKPANILLGRYGETLVVDWGLAKQLGAGDELTGDSEEARAVSLPPPAGEGTQPGAVLGTPAYMSPEQAAGHGDQAGPADDIYSLGATLYVLLTGQAPFQGRHLGEVLDKVRQGDFPAPRQGHSQVPPALEAICLKAMARRPEGRYASALEVAADLESWLADAPVRAWREPWTVRVRRWCGRHRTLVTAATAVGLAVTVSLAAATVLLTAANQRERQARQEAMTNFRLARQAVDRYFLQVSRDPRLRDHDLDHLRRELLLAAKQSCDEFVRLQSTDPDVRAEQGQAYELLGVVTQEIGAKDQAVPLHQQAVDVFTQLAEAYPGVSQYRRSLGRNYDHLGYVYQLTGRPDLAEKAFGQALEVRARLADQFPEEAAYRNDLAKAHNRLGNLYRVTGPPDQAREQLDQALTFARRLVAEQPTVLEYQISLADVHNDRGVLFHATHQAAAAIEDELRQSHAIWEQIVAAHPTVGDYQNRLAKSHQNLAILYTDTGRPQQAEEAFRKALAVRAQMAQAHPTVSDYQSKLARSYHALGALYHRDPRRQADAEAAYQKGLEIHQELVRKHPDVPDYAVDLGKSYGRLGHLFKNSNPQAALKWFSLSQRTHEGVLQQQAGHPEARVSLGHVHEGRAEALTRLTDYAEALRAWDQALELADQPNRETWRMLRALTQARAGEHGPATQAADALVAQAPPGGAVQYNAACVYALAAAVAAGAPVADGYAARAVTLLAQAHTAGFFRMPGSRTKLARDPDLTVLRSRADFQKLQQEVDKESMRE